MKFLVLVLCVCTAISSSFGNGRYGRPQAYPNLAAPAVAAKAVSAAAAPAVAPVPVAATTNYPAGSSPYQAAKQVANKAYSSNDGQAAILRSKSSVRRDGFRYIYETENGISAESTGTYQQVGNAGGVVFQGFYRYTSPDGTPVYVTYTADSNGYHPQSDILPVAPAVPEAILRSIAYIAARSKDTVQK